MKLIFVDKSKIFILFFIFVTIILLNQCSQKNSNTLLKTQYAGSAKCQSCHNNIYNQHLTSFHHTTSAIANSANILRNKDSLNNKYYFQQNLYVAIENINGVYYQTAYQNNVEKVKRPMSIITGSGKRGQTFLYWHNNNIFQLPLTYFSETEEWTNSPGYGNSINFNRPVTARCLECHATYFEEINDTNKKADEFLKVNMILGVECEKCHGSGIEHITYHEKNINDKIPHFIISPKNLTRTQNLDLCRLCHGGHLTKTKPSFSFQAGNDLWNYFEKDTVSKNINEIDVHGNQYGMLSLSKCFLQSQLTCNTCHDAHKKENNNGEIINIKCINCHQQTTQNNCKLAKTTPANILENNCINCHMPEQPSNAIMVLRQGQNIPTPAHMRSHYISIYKQVSNQVLQKINSLK